MQETFPVQPPYGKSPARHPDYFTDGLSLVIDKTQGGNRKDFVEGSVPKGKGSEVPPAPEKGVGTVGAGIMKPFEIPVETGDPEPFPEESAGEPSRPATRIEN